MLGGQSLPDAGALGPAELDALFADHLPQPGGGSVPDYRQQMTVEQFAQRYPSVADTEQLVQINQWYDGVTLPAGTAVKRVVR